MNLKKISRKLYLAYYQYKDSPYYQVSLYGGILLVSVILLVTIIIPQVSNWLSVQEEVARTRERIRVMNNNIAFLQSLSNAELENNFSVATTALPPERDVATLIAAINTAAITSGVALDDFGFQSGEVSSRSTASRIRDGNERDSLTFTARGELPQILNLLLSLQAKIPLLSLSSVDARFDESNRIEITVSYFTKAFPLIREENDTEIKGISTPNQTLLQELETWQVPLSESASGSSTSASLLPPL